MKRVNIKDRRYKRVGRRRRELGLGDLEAYRAFLIETPAEWARLDAYCRIPISRFYRDRGVFDYLGRSALPELAESAVARGGEAFVLPSLGEKPVREVGRRSCAGLVNVSRPSVQRATKVLANCAEGLVAAVDRGQVTVTDAAAIAKEPHRMQLALLGRVASGKVSTLHAALRKQDLAQLIQEIEDGE